MRSLISYSVMRPVVIVLLHPATDGHVGVIIYDEALGNIRELHFDPIADALSLDGNLS